MRNRTFALGLVFVLHLLSVERLVEGLLRKVVYIAILAAFESFQQLFLDLDGDIIWVYFSIYFGGRGINAFNLISAAIAD